MGSNMVDRLDGAGELTGSFKVVDLKENLQQAWGGGSTALAFDGSHIWVTVSSADSVVKLTTDGVVQDVYDVGRWPTAVIVAGGSVWVANFLDDTVSRLAPDGRLLDTLSVGKGPHALLAVGKAVWVANFQGDSLTKLPCAEC